MPATKIKKTLTSQGFTIVEVMFVLIIAGIIAAIVLMAIPALQRSSRNHSRRQDVAAILQAVSEHELKNSAEFPPNNSFLSYTELSYYDKSKVISHSPPPGSPVNITAQIASDNSSAEEVNIYQYETCDPDNPNVGKAEGAGYRDIIALYYIETSGGLSAQCDQL